MENLNRPIVIKEIEIVFENLFIKKSMESVSSVENSTKRWRKNCNPSQTCQKTVEKKTKTSCENQSDIPRSMDVKILNKI